MTQQILLDWLAAQFRWQQDHPKQQQQRQPQPPPLESPASLGVSPHVSYVSTY
jgi:hypothetical protein